MKLLILLFICVYTAPSLFAQDVTDLSYPEIDSLLNLWESEQEYAKGIQLSLDASEKSGKQDSLCGEYLEWVACFYNLIGKKAEAIEYYEKTLHVFEKAMGVNSPRYATALNFVGLFYKGAGDYKKALTLYVQAKDIRERVLGKEHVDYALSLNNIAALHRKMGNYSKALPLYIQSIGIEQKILGKDDIEVALSLNNLAMLYQSMGNYSEALRLYIQAKNIIEKVVGRENPDYALSLNNLAMLHITMGNYSQALPLSIQSKDIMKEIFGKDHPNFANTLNNLAMLHGKMGNYSQALSFLVQAIDIIEKTLGNGHPFFATLLNNLAELHQKMNNYPEALGLYLQAKDILEKVFGKEHLEFGQALNNLAGLYKKMNNYQEALPLLVQAKDIKEQVLGKEHPTFTRTVNNLAYLHESMGNYDKAWVLLSQTIHSSSKITVVPTFDKNWVDTFQQALYPSNDHLENMMTSLDVMSKILQNDSSIEDAASKQTVVADLAIKLLNRFQNEVSNDKDKLRMLAESSNWLKRSLSILDRKKEAVHAFELADQNKSVLLLQATKSEQAYRLGNLPDSLVWKDKKLFEKQSQLQAKLLERRTKVEKDSLRNELNKINQATDDFIKMVKREYPKYHQLKYQKTDANIKSIQALLDDHTALLEYVIGDSVIHIFYVDKNQVVWSKSFVANKTLNNRINSLHQALSDYTTLMKDEKMAYRNYTKQAHWFYQTLIAPALKDKQDIVNLIIISDGALGHLPFETFLVEQVPQRVTDYRKMHYLVNDFNISYNYSATLWKENGEAPSPINNGQILGVAANYDIKLDTSLIDVRLLTDQRQRAELSLLPAARKEVETLQEKYQGFFAFDKIASEKTVKRKASDYAILHFATHGILENRRPVLSSLAFTEDSDSLESNFWQAHEISKLELNANLVVLSACETGYGKFEKGNGIASLARAFMYAGASSLIVSLWQVNDYATAEIMKNLYDNLANGMKKDAALKQAKLQYIKSSEGITAHPAFWSPFIMMGNSEPIQIKKKGNSMAWGIGIGLLVLLGIGGFLSLRKRK